VQRELEQREQAEHLGLVGHQARQHPAEADRLARQVGAHPVVARGGGRALGEDQVQHAEHRTEPPPALGGRRQLERHLGRCQRLLGPGDPRLHGGGRHQERPSDLVAGQAAEHPEGERDLGLAGQHRVARDEHQRELVVVDPVRVPEQVGLRVGSEVRVAGEDGVPLVEGRAASVCVDRTAPAHGQQPAGRVAGYAVARPGDQRLGERLLGEVLGQREVAGEAGQRGDDVRGLDPPHRLHGLASASRTTHSWPVDSRQARSFWIHGLSCGNSSMVGTRRISAFMPGPDSGARLAHSTASSFEATSRIQ
jgi:hypothetical protein